MAEDFESSLAEVAMLQVDVMKIGGVDLPNGANCVAQNGPTELHDFIFGGGEWGSGEPGDDSGERRRTD